VSGFVLENEIKMLITQIKVVGNSFGAIYFIEHPWAKFAQIKIKCLKYIKLLSLLFLAEYENNYKTLLPNS